MDRLRQMQVFVAVAEEEGFAAAARRLQISPPAVTRMISALEQDLDTTLLIRTTRHVRVTEAGLKYLDDCRRILADIHTAEAQAAGLQATPQGQLTLTAPIMFGRYHVMPVVQAYLKRYPDVQAEVLLLDRVANLMEEGIDIAVRIGELPDSTMYARRVGAVRKVVVASPDYLQQAGTPKHPEGLKQHCIIAPQAGDQHLSAGGHWRFYGPQGEVSTFFKPRLSVSNNEIAIDAAANGFGITRVLSYQVAEHIQTGALQVLLEDFEPPPHPIHIMHREGRHRRAQVRAFIEMIVEELRESSVLNPSLLQR